MELVTRSEGVSPCFMKTVSLRSPGQMFDVDGALSLTQSCGIVVTVV